MNRQGRFNPGTGQTWAIVRLAARKFLRINGTQWPRSFDFNAFFALFPLMVLLVAIASLLIDRERSGATVIAYVEAHVPIGGDMRSYIVDPIAGAIKARGRAGNGLALPHE